MTCPRCRRKQYYECAYRSCVCHRVPKGKKAQVHLVHDGLGMPVLRIQGAHRLLEEAGDGRSVQVRCSVVTRAVVAGSGLRISTVWRATIKSLCSESEGVEMSTLSSKAIKRSRWLDWQPKPRITADSAKSEPTKPTKPGFVGFDGSIPREVPIVQPRILDGHQVSRVIWETECAVVFEDDQGHFWRYLHAYRQCWPVVMGSLQRSHY